MTSYETINNNNYYYDPSWITQLLIQELNENDPVTTELITNYLNTLSHDNQELILNNINYSNVDISTAPPSYPTSPSSPASPTSIIDYDSDPEMPPLIDDNNNDEDLYDSISDSDSTQLNYPQDNVLSDHPIMGSSLHPKQNAYIP